MRAFRQRLFSDRIRRRALMVYRDFKSRGATNRIAYLEAASRASHRADVRRNASNLLRAESPT